MKYLLQILSAMVVLIAAVSCNEETLVNQIIDDVETGAILRNLGETNSLDSAAPASTYSIQLEAQDGENGNLLREVRVSVGFSNEDGQGAGDVGLTLFETIPASSFSETSDNGLPKTTFTTTLEDLLAHVNLSQTDVNVGDLFIIDFALVLTDGRTFNLSNATSDVTRTGRFSYFNAQFQYAPAIQDPGRVTVTDVFLGAKSNGRSLNGETDTVFVSFDRAIDVLPTVTRISAQGNTDDVMGPLTQVSGEDTEYYFLYTAGAAVADTISFSLSGAGATGSTPSYTTNFKNAFIIDNIIDASLAASEGTVENGEIDDIMLTFDFGEPLAGDSITYEVSSPTLPTPEFDAFTVTQAVLANDQTSTLTFTPRSGGNKIPVQTLVFDVRITGATDKTGNEIDETISVTMF